MSRRQSRRATTGLKSEASSGDEAPIISAVQPSGPHERKRFANLYDAVAGRVTTTESLRTYHTKRDQSRHPQRLPSSSPDAKHASQRDPRVPPQDVLFRRRQAPERFAEKDVYFASEELPDGGIGVLPDSDLLKSVHAYSSRFYEALGHRVGPSSFVGSRLIDERSMDETALLAMGILLEEAARETLGKRGDLVFTEGVDDCQADGRGEGKKETQEEVAVGHKSDDELWRRKYPKRLKATQPKESEDEGEAEAEAL